MLVLFNENRLQMRARGVSFEIQPCGTHRLEVSRLGCFIEYWHV